ncbi:hypothetical protein WS86_30590 [Burkholderia savannae]|uniref:hypothetical protein n=1 Tax=Burkholderia savannae TaxID=1637837 RepID=UPI00075DB9A8|nr:hypothetical protein [Burkholderia savannae]AOJ84837.1 hypothetical protein WS86_30590 [Burkholderia savannae]
MTARTSLRLNLDATPGTTDGAPLNADIGSAMRPYPVRHPHPIRLAIGLLIVVAGVFVLALHGSTLI